MSALLALLLQAAPAAAVAGAAPAAMPQRFSVLPGCPLPHGDEVVVCAAPDGPRLPLRDERGPPDGSRKATGDPRAALDAGDPGACALRGCQVGVDMVGMGVAAVRLIGKLVDPASCCERPGDGTGAAVLLRDTAAGVNRAFARKPDRAGRVAIALDDPPPPIAGRLSP